MGTRGATEDQQVIAPHRTAAGVLAAAALAATACGSQQSNVDVRAVLQHAKQAIDATPALHFTLSSKDAKGPGTLITGGQGDAARPDKFSGSLTVKQAGFTLTVQILSSGGTFWAQLPFTSGWQKTDPSSYGFGNPATLLDPDKGLSSLLVDATSASDAGRDRYQGEELQEINVTLPGDRVAALLTSADKSKPVTGVIGVATGSNQIRRVVLTGPFFDAGQTSTYTLILDRYGENVTITPPPS